MVLSCGSDIRFFNNMKILPRYYPVLPGCQNQTANPNLLRLTGKNLFHYREKPVSLQGTLISLQGFPCKPLYFAVQNCSGVQTWFFKNIPKVICLLICGEDYCNIASNWCIEKLSTLLLGQPDRQTWTRFIYAFSISISSTSSIS